MEENVLNNVLEFKSICLDIIYVIFIFFYWLKKVICLELFLNERRKYNFIMYLEVKFDVYEFFDN